MSTGRPWHKISPYPVYHLHQLTPLLVLNTWSTFLIIRYLGAAPHCIINWHVRGTTWFCITWCTYIVLYTTPCGARWDGEIHI